MDEQLRIDADDVRDLIEWHEKIRAGLSENINRILSQYRHISEVLIEERQRSRQKNKELVTQLLRPLASFHPARNQPDDHWSGLSSSRRTCCLQFFDQRRKDMKVFCKSSNNHPIVIPSALC